MMSLTIISYKLLKNWKNINLTGNEMNRVTCDIYAESLFLLTYQPMKTFVLLSFGTVIHYGITIHVWGLHIFDDSLYQAF